jgi:hypothetical protein
MNCETVLSVEIEATFHLLRIYLGASLGVVIKELVKLFVLIRVFHLLKYFHIFSLGVIFLQGVFLLKVIENALLFKIFCCLIELPSVKFFLIKYNLFNKREILTFFSYFILYQRI